MHSECLLGQRAFSSLHLFYFLRLDQRKAAGAGTCSRYHGESAVGNRQHAKKKQGECLQLEMSARDDDFYLVTTNRLRL